MPQTKLENLVNPQVMGDMISATLPKQIKFTNIAGVDTTLTGTPGDTITVPKYAYIGDAEDVAEGVAMGTTVLTASTTTAKVKKAGKAVELTDEAVLSGYGDPVGEATRQLAMAIASKIDEDCLAALNTASLKYTGTAAISYTGVVDAVDLLADENDGPTDKVIYIAPSQITTLRKDENFLDINKYPINNGVIMTGEIGSICGCRVIVSKRIVAADGKFINPIVVTATNDPNEDPAADAFSTTAPAITIYMKRAAQVESDRDILAKTTVISADEHYAVALSNDSKVVLATFTA